MINPISKAIETPKVIYKPFKIPKGLIYDAPTNDYFYLINTKTGELAGKMCAKIENDYDNMYNQGKKTKLFYINYLNIQYKEQGKGWGKYLIDFAKNKSLEMKSEGRVSLFAFNPEEPPHLFYKKLGFISKNNKKNKIMDECIRKRKPAPNWYGLRMYLPIENNEKKENVINKFIKLCSIF